MTETTFVHHNPLTPLGPHAWHWEIVLYLFLGGLAAGLMIISALMARRVEQPSRWMRWAPLGAPLLISVGMLALWLDLESRLTAYRFYLALKPTSPMSWGAWILLGIYPATILLGLGQLTREEGERLSAWKPLALLRLGALVSWAQRWGAAHLKGLRASNLVLGIALGGYTGILLSGLGGSRPIWNSSILAPLFLVSGFSTGAALLMLFALKEEERQVVRRWDLGAIALEVTLLGLFLLGLISGGGSERAAGDALLGGSYTAVFWSLVMVAGLLVPFVIELFEHKKHLRHTIFAPMLLLAGGLVLRWVMVSAGQSIT